MLTHGVGLLQANLFFLGLFITGLWGPKASDQPCAACRCLPLGLYQIRPSDTVVPPPLPPAPTCLQKSQVWPFVLMQTVSVSVAIVEMDRAKLNLISFGRKIEFSTL